MGTQRWGDGGGWCVSWWRLSFLISLSPLTKQTEVRLPCWYNSSTWEQISVSKKKYYCPIWFCLSFNQSKPDSHYLRGFKPGCTISCCGNYMFTDDYNAPIQSMTSVDCNANKTQSSFVILKVKALKKVKQVIRYSPQKAETRPRLAPQLSQSWLV